MRNRVLLDPIVPHLSATPLAGTHDHRAKAGLQSHLERNAGLQRPLGMRRIVVPFFGGADDRAAVELLRKVVLNSPGSVQGVVITFTSARDTEASQMNAAVVEANMLPPTALPEHLMSEEEHIDSINLQTIHQKEAARVDARFLFHQQDASNATSTVKSIPEEVVAAAAASHTTDPSTATEEEPQEKPDGDNRASTTRTEAGIVILTLPSTAETPLNPITAMSRVLLPLLDEQHDMVFVGRGKWNQRPKEFRQEVERMHAEQLSLEEIREETRTIGSCLGL